MPSRFHSEFPDLTETTLTSERVLEGKMIRVDLDRVRLPDGSESWREYVLHPGAVIIAAFLDEDTLIFEHQFRYPVRRHFIELPAGKIDIGEPHAETARRELLEETGHTAAYWRHAVTLHAGIGYSNEVIELYVAKQLTHVGHQRDGHGRDFLDARRHRERADQPAEPLHALAGGSGEPERFGNDPAVDGRLRAIAQEGRAVQSEDLRAETPVPTNSID